MNRKLLIAALILFCLVVVGAVYFFATRNTTIPNPSDTTATSFPQSGSNQGTSGGGNTSYTIEDANGNSIAVKDFIHNGETIPDTENAGSYLVAGSLGYCLPNTACTAASSTDFNIFYDDTEKAFTISLLTEPIGEARHNAEQFLMNQLGLTKDEMCSLKYYVGTTYWVNEQYSSGNLGFSFCPGAVRLP